MIPHTIPCRNVFAREIVTTEAISHLRHYIDRDTIIMRGKYMKILSGVYLQITFHLLSLPPILRNVF
jgi:hypothetical protein